jgi:hypothetical protein
MDEPTTRRGAAPGNLDGLAASGKDGREFHLPNSPSQIRSRIE